MPSRYSLPFILLHESHIDYHTLELDSKSKLVQDDPARQAQIQTIHSQQDLH